MNAVSFDTLPSLGADACSRRASLFSLLAAGLVGIVSAPPAASRKKSGKNKKVKKLAAKKCKSQVGQCRSVAATCPDEPSCQEIAELCCPILGSCDITEFLGCMQAAIT